MVRKISLTSLLSLRISDAVCETMQLQNGPANLHREEDMQLLPSRNYIHIQNARRYYGFEFLGHVNIKPLRRL